MSDTGTIVVSIVGTGLAATAALESDSGED